MTTATKRAIVPKAKTAHLNGNGKVHAPARLRRTFRVVSKADPIEGDALWADIASLTFDEIDAVRELIGGERTFTEIMPAIAPFVVRWNARKYDLETGEYQDVPPPAEWGEKALRTQEPWVTTWLLFELRDVRVVPDFLFGAPPPSPTPDGAGESSTT